MRRNCKMCPRNVWIDEENGDMDMDLFHTLMRQAKELEGLKSVFFGGVAEPMSHEHIIEMVKTAKELGVKVELISNGSFLDKNIIGDLLEAGLDMLWVSIDTVHNESCDENINVDGYEKAKANLRAFNICRREINPDAEFGIALVAMKSNIHELPEIITVSYTHLRA